MSDAAVFKGLSSAGRHQEEVPNEVNTSIVQGMEVDGGEGQ